MSTAAAATRVFTEDKIIESRALNLAGVQVLRTLLARCFYAVRGRSDPALGELTKSGLMVCEDFLPHSQFVALQREADEYIAKTSPTAEYLEGTTQVHHFSLGAVTPERFPNVAQWPDNERVIRMVSAAERRRLRKRDGVRVLEQIRLGDYSVPDQQTDLHADTFFNTHKVWLYLDAVSEENAPLVYVPGSQQTDRVRLGRDYRESRTTNRGSRRVSDEEVRLRGLERRVVTCPANTLVVVNTHGYHCRSVGASGASRRALHMSFRFNPFSLRQWPAPPWRALSRRAT